MNRKRTMTRLARELSVQLALIPPIQPAVFISRLADARGFAIELIPFPMLGTVSGYTLRISETEFLVYYDRDASPRRLARVIYHESGHIILGHVAVSTPAEIKRFLDALNIASMGRTPGLFRRQRYSLAWELDAEALAIALTELSFTYPGPALLFDHRSGVKPSEIAAFYDELEF